MMHCSFIFVFKIIIFFRNTRQKLLEQQKMNFLEKQKMQLKNQTVVTSNTNYKSNLDNLKAYLPVEKPELDYEKLSVLVPKNESYYEPGKPNVFFFSTIFIHKLIEYLIKYIIFVVMIVIFRSKSRWWQN